MCQKCFWFSRRMKVTKMIISNFLILARNVCVCVWRRGGPHAAAIISAFICLIKEPKCVRSFTPYFIPYLIPLKGHIRGTERHGRIQPGIKAKLWISASLLSFIGQIE